MLFKRGIDNVFSDCRGSVLVEVALIVPAIMFLVLAGVTLVHIVELTRATDRAAVLIADEFAQKTTLEEADFDMALAAVATLIGSSGFPVDLWINIKTVEVDTAGATIIWSRSRANGGNDCRSADTVLTAPSGIIVGAGRFQFVQADICATPTAGFFLSGVLEVAGYTLQGRAISVGRHASTRSLE